VLDEILSFVERQAERERDTFLNMPEERRAIHAYLTVESHEVWHTVSEEAGISLSGFLEALAADMREFPPESGGHPRWREIIRSARKIDAQRRRRGAA
jgi:hypothetical protein